jgi:hypothetical protein
MNMTIVRRVVLSFAVLLCAAGAEASIVTAPGDLIYAITVAAGNPSPSTIVFPGNNLSGAPQAIDNSVFTKYSNLNGTAANLAAGNYVGFVVTPSMGATILDSVRFVAGDDFPDRDPLTILIYGTNTPISPGLVEGNTINAAWTLLYNGTSGLSTDPGREQLGTLVPFVPLSGGGFSSYQVLATTNRGSAITTQYSEILLDGTAAPAAGSAPEPATAYALALGLAGIVARRFAARMK